MPLYGDMSGISRESLGIAESEYVPAHIETVRIINVNIEDWSVDCVSDEANKRFFDIQVMSPYFHFAGGEGWYCMPEVGALAWICKPSLGKMAAPFILGFQAPFDESQASYQANRQALNPGDMMWRTRDDNFIILRRGGVVQIGATPTCQTMHVPIQNLIRHFCENWEINHFGGEMLWTTERDDQSTDGSAPTTLAFNIKSKANDPGHIAHLTLGSHGEDNPTTIGFVIKESGEKDAKVMVTCKLTKTGDVNWDVERDFKVIAKRSISLSTEEGDISLDSAKDFTAHAKENMILSADGDWKGSSKGTSELSGGVKTILEAPVIELGAGARHPNVYGDELVKWLTEVCTSIGLFACASPGSPVVGAAAVAAKAAQLSKILSVKVKTD